MSTTETTGKPPDVSDELEQAIQSLSKPRDPKFMRQASARMDRMREELRKTHGEMDIAVDLIRDARNPE